jgi:hypothetical protein
MARKGIPGAVREGRKSEEVVNSRNGRGGNANMAMSEGSKLGLLVLLGLFLLFGLHVLGLVLFGQLLILAWRHPIYAIVVLILILYAMRSLWRRL